MTNSTSNTEIVDTLMDVFLTWMQNDIIPFITTTLDILIIIVGVILNSALLVTFRKKGLMNEASTYFVLVLAIVDFLAYALILLPTIITAIAGKWLLSDPACQLHGAVNSYLMFVNFTFLSVLAIERGLKLCKPDRHDSVFEVRKYVYIITSMVWSVTGIVAFLPVSGLAVIKYEFYHQGCMLDYEASPVFLLVNFLLTLVLSIIIFSVSYGYIFNSRRNALIANRNSAFTKQKQPAKREKHTGIDNPLPVIDENDDDTNAAFVKTEYGKKVSQVNTATKPVQGKARGKKRPESPKGVSMVFEIFSDDHENPAFHLAVTYISLWASILLCYLPYFIVAFYGTFNSGGLWRGFYAVTLLVTHISFVVKPFIYLGHNKHYRSVTKETVPEAVKKRARSVRSSFSGVADKVEDLMFRSSAKKGLGNVVATHKAILIWKTKMKMKQENTKESKTAIKDLTTNTTETSLSSTENNTFDTSTGDRKGTFNQEHLRSQPTTPSGILLTASSATSSGGKTSTSSFIENERQKLLASSKGYSLTPYASGSSYNNASHWNTPNAGPPNPDDKDLPGMVGGSDVNDKRSNSVSPLYGSLNDQLRLI